MALWSNARASILDLSGLLPVTMNRNGNTVSYQVADQGQVRSGSDTSSAVNSLSNADGMVAWHDGAKVWMRFYDPAKTNWVKIESTPAGAPVDLRNGSGLVAWRIGQNVYFAAYDQAQGLWVGASQASGTTPIANLTATNGVVAWSAGTLVFSVVYDPIRRVWKPTASGAASVFQFSAGDGMVAWRSTAGGISAVNYRTYDAAGGVWLEGQLNNFTGTVFSQNMLVSPGVVAWWGKPGVGNPIVYFRAFDPTTAQWVGGSSPSSAINVANFALNNGTVTWSENAQLFSAGYSVSNHVWSAGSTVPFAAFTVSTNAGNPPLPVYFANSSLGASGYNWNFGDGASTNSRSPFHRFRTFARTTATLTVSGSGPSHSARVVITNDVSPPVGGIAINGGESFTTNPVVNLVLSATDNSGVVTHMRFSNTNNQAFAAWEPYATNKTWTLLTGVGTRTVYAQFRDGVDNISAVTNDTIELDTTPIPTAFFNPTNDSTFEGDGAAVIEVLLSAPFTRPVAVNFFTMDGTALAGSDYIATNGLLVFAPGQTRQTFPLRITNDSLVELNETLTLNLASISNSTLGSPLTFTILDDDPPTLGFANPAISTSENGGVVTVQVALSAPSGQTISVGYATTQSGTAQPAVDFQPVSGVLTFGPGQTSRSFSIDITDDLLDELSETVVLVLLNPTNALPGVVAATLTILDDDPPTARFSLTNHLVTEPAGPAVVRPAISVVLSKPFDREVKVHWNIVGGTATEGADFPIFPVLPVELSIPANVTNQTFSIPIQPDTVAEGDETIELELTPFSNVFVGEPRRTTLTIVDDDVPPRIVNLQHSSGGLELTLEGAVGQRFAVQVSTNLPVWQHFVTLTNVTGHVNYTVPISTNGGPRFYRTAFPAP